MTQPYAPRLNYLRPDLWRPNIENYLARIGKTLSKTCANPQAAQSGVASGYEAVGLFYYATGYPIEQVRDALAHAAQAYLKVFELRGTQPPFPVTLVTLDPGKKPGEPGLRSRDGRCTPRRRGPFPNELQKGSEGRLPCSCGHRRRACG